MPVGPMEAGRWRQRTKEEKETRTANVLWTQIGEEQVCKPSTVERRLLAALVTGAIHGSNLKRVLDASADLLWRQTTNWRTGCKKFAWPVRREGEACPPTCPSFLPLSNYTGQSSSENHEAVCVEPCEFTRRVPWPDLRVRIRFEETTAWPLLAIRAPHESGADCVRWFRVPRLPE
jgi:hypothetical protein